MIEFIYFTRCNTHRWPYTDSEINHIRHFIKIQFVNKGIEFINLPSICKEKNMLSLLFLLILKIRNHLSIVISTINLIGSSEMIFLVFLKYFYEYSRIHRTQIP